MQYRAEIDGLRAIAVSIVILFHAGFNIVSGGYVGVDVFFVISGYLITSIILQDMDKGKFSLTKFYERRARRILPALYFIMLVTAIFAWFWLIPRDFKSFAKSVAAVSVFLSNIQFARELGYFDTASELKPLLHTWSLAVEEQYYAIFPVLMLLLWRFGKPLVLASLLVLGLASLAYAQWYAHDKQAGVYFLLTARGWEILLGAYLAFYINRKNHVTASLLTSQVFSLVGLALILYAAFAFDDNIPFPSMYTLVPTIGAALIILYANKGTLTENLLSRRLLVGLGLISYSAYLWHQPLFAFAKYLSIAEPPVAMMAGLSVSSFILAYFSWKYIEMPFRGKELCDSRCIFKFGAYGLVSFFLVGVLFVSKTFKSRFELDDINFMSNMTNNNYLSGTACKDFKVLEKEATCKIYGEGQKLVVIWGDSHANVLSRRMPNDILPANTKIMVITHDGCAPLVGVVKAEKDGASGNCYSKSTLTSYAYYIRSKSPQKVILVGRWTMYLRGLHRKGVLQKIRHYMALDENQPVSELNSKEAKEALEVGLTNTLEFFPDSELYVLGQPPDLNFMNERMVFFSKKTERKRIDSWHSSEVDVFNKIHAVNYKYINTRDYFCDQEECDLRINNQPIYFDDNHLKGYGLDRLWDIIKNQMMYQVAHQ